MIRKNGGITLIALVITILVLLILAGVSINAVVGDNGLIAQAMESRIVTIIADIVFKLEDNIVDINTGNILQNKVSIASDVMKELENRKLLLEDEEDEKGPLSSMQQQINDNRLIPLYLGFNGDIWYNNFKRGKVKLTSQSMTLTSSTTGAKIVVNDGTIEELIPDYKYYLHSLENRDDFYCWVNSYGEIVSTFKDTIIYTKVPRDEEFTAIYQEKDNDGNTTLNQYIEWLKPNYDGEDLEGTIEYGLNSSILKKGNEVYFEAQLTHNKFTNFYRDKKLGEENNCVLNNGIKVNSIVLFVSDKYDDLLLNEDQDDIAGDFDDDNHFCDAEYYNGVNITMFPKGSNHYIEENLDKEAFLKRIEESSEVYDDYEDQDKEEWDKYTKFDYFEKYFSEYIHENVIDKYEQYYEENKSVEDVPEEEREKYKEYKKYLDFKNYYDNDYEIEDIPENYQKEYKEYKKALDFDEWWYEDVPVENVPGEYQEEYREYKRNMDFEYCYDEWLDDEDYYWYGEWLIETFYSWEEYYDYEEYREYLEMSGDYDAHIAGYMKDTEQWPWERIGFYDEYADEEFYESYYITVVNYNDEETPKNVFENKWSPLIGENYETTIPIINNEDNLKYTSEIEFISTDISDMLSEFINKEGVNRLYYRVAAEADNMYISPLDEFSLNEAYGSFSEDTKKLTDFGWRSYGGLTIFSPVIKYIDL